MASILKKAAKYKRISTVLYEGEAHLRDAFTPAPVILKPPTPRTEKKPDDITDFPQQKIIPIPESRPYPEGNYRPPSIPFVAGFYPYNCYLEKGKVYSWCACGLSINSPWCDGMCNANVTRNRPIVFNVDEAGYYKICNCKFSANAPFCNNTHRMMIRAYHHSHRGFWEMQGEILFFVMWGYLLWNYYT